MKIGDDEKIICLTFDQSPNLFCGITTRQIWPYLGTSKCWGHSVLQTPALVIRFVWFCLDWFVSVMVLGFVLFILLTRSVVALTLSKILFQQRDGGFINISMNMFVNK